MRIIESHLQSKMSPVPDGGGEDRIVVTEHYAAVIDGATAKTKTKYHYEGREVTTGIMAAEILKKGVMDLSPDMDPKEVCIFLNQRMRDAYEAHGMLETAETNPVERFSATLALFNAKQRYILLVCDSQVVFGGQHYQYEMEIDRVRSTIRANEIERTLQSGEMTFEEYSNIPSEQCPGRLLAFVPPVDGPLADYHNQGRYQNTPGLPFSYFLLDGFANYDTVGWGVIPVPEHVTELILATDGYPVLKGTDPVEGLRNLATAENLIQRVTTEDPACFRLYKSTKGMGSSNFSFDDHAYLRLAIEAA